MYKIPFKQTFISNTNNSTPLNSDFNNFYGTIFSSGNNHKDGQTNNWLYLQNKDNFFYIIKITPL